MMEILNVLCPPSINPADDQSVRKSMLAEDTGTWIFEVPQYVAWEDSCNSFLWLNGQSIPS